MKRLIIATLLSATMAAPVCAAEETKAYWIGDVNGDGKVNMADVTALVAMLKGDDNEATKKLNRKAADVNRDSDIDKDDVTALVNIVLGKTPKKFINEDIDEIPIGDKTGQFD